MVYCRYCGVQNRTGELKCSNCGKPLSLMPNEPQVKPMSSSNNQSLRGNSSRNNPNQYDSIKSRYVGKNQNNQNNQSNQNHQNQQRQQYQQNPQNQQYQDQRNYQNQQYQNQQNYQNQRNQYDNQYQRSYQDQRAYQNYQRNQEYSDNLRQNGLNQQYSQHYVHEPKVSKTAIEWDVVIATALMVIILTAILQRIFPVYAIFISLLLGLAYILIATKSKASLIKSMPLTLLTILAISAYFSL